MNLVATIANGNNFEQLFSISRRYMENYADKIGADFLVLKENGNHANPGYRKFDISEYLDMYDRIMYLDIDIIVANDTPNLFEIVPADAIGMFRENGAVPMVEYWTRHDLLKIFGKYRVKYIEAVGIDAFNKMFPMWESLICRNNIDYFNSGVVIYSREHRHIFELPHVEIGHPRYEQTYFNILLAKHNAKMFHLDVRYNRMNGWEMFNRAHLVPSYDSCYLLHAAGSLDKIYDMEHYIYLLKEKKRI